MSSRYAECRCGGSVAAPSTTEARIAMCEVEVLERLLAREGQVPWTRVSLECAIGGNALDLSDALYNLAAAGVIYLSEESVTLSRTARNWMLRLRVDVLAAGTRCGGRTGRCAGSLRRRDRAYRRGDQRNQDNQGRNNNAEKQGCGTVPSATPGPLSLS